MKSNSKSQSRHSVMQIFCLYYDLGSLFKPVSATLFCSLWNPMRWRSFWLKGPCCSIAYQALSTGWFYFTGLSRITKQYQLRRLDMYNVSEFYAWVTLFGSVLQKLGTATYLGASYRIIAWSNSVNPNQLKALALQLVWYRIIFGYFSREKLERQPLRVTQIYII